MTETIVQQVRKKIKEHGLPLAFFRAIRFMSWSLKRKYWMAAVRGSYSQCGEDLIIDEILGNKKDGCYLDIGAYDPTEFSNTRRFYDRGWRGCNVEPEPNRYGRFVDKRPRDVNLNVGISDVEGSLMFYHMFPETLSTFSEERAREVEHIGGKLIKKIMVPVIPMQEIFQKHFDGRTVDFCTIDTEGMDLQILRSNDWTKYRPRVLCVETALISGENSVSDFLQSVGYKKAGVTRMYREQVNEIYKDARSGATSS
jgi:FkbM family methyltransferase